MSISGLLRRVAPALAVAVLLSLAGCMKSDEKAVIAKDGSGTVKTVMTMDLEKLKSLQDMVKGMGGEMGGGEGEEGVEDPMDDFDPEELKEKLKGKEGVELVSATKKVSDDGKSATVTIELKFKSLKQLYEAGAMQMSDGSKISLEQKDGAWTFTRVMGGMGGGDEEPGPEAAGMMEMFASFFEGMEFAATYTVPGQITATNGTKDEAGSTVSWKIVGKDIMKADARKQFVTFTAAEGATLQAFTWEATEDAEVEEPAGAGAPGN